MKPEYVYVVMRGEENEGGRIIGVFRKESDANKCRDRLRAATSTYSCDWTDTEKRIIRESYT